MQEIKTISIIGMGAMGMLYGSLILSSDENFSLSYVAESERIQKYKKMTFTVNGVPQDFPLTESSKATPSDLVIVAVKGPALDDALDTMKNCIGPDTIIISVMNGITSEEIIGRRYGMEKVIYCVAQGMDAVKFGGDLTYVNCGELRVGITHAPNPCASEEKLAILTRFFDKAHIPYVVEDDIIYRLWGKFMLNVGVNQVCMVYELDYGSVLNKKEYFDLFVAAMEEVRVIAAAEGIDIPEAEIRRYIDVCRSMSPTGMPSMRQDGLTKRPSEVGLFSGTVREIAARHNIPVPVNDMLYEAIRQKEASY